MNKINIPLTPSQLTSTVYYTLKHLLSYVDFLRAHNTIYLQHAPEEVHEAIELLRSAGVTVRRSENERTITIIFE